MSRSHRQRNNEGPAQRGLCRRGSAGGGMQWAASSTWVHRRCGLVRWGLRDRGLWGRAMQQDDQRGKSRAKTQPGGRALERASASGQIRPCSAKNGELSIFCGIGTSLECGVASLLRQRERGFYLSSQHFEHPAGSVRAPVTAGARHNFGSLRQYSREVSNGVAWTAAGVSCAEDPQQAQGRRSVMLSWTPPVVGQTRPVLPGIRCGL